MPKIASAKIANSLLVTTFSGPLARYLQRWQDRLFHCKMNILPARLIASLFLAISGLCGSLFADQKFDDLRKAAEQGLASAQNNLGVAYDNGEGVAKDLVEAVKWYGKAAEQGNAKAQFNLGVAYYKGEGVAKNLVEGYAWNHLAAVTDDYAKLQQTNLEKVMSSQQVAAGQRRSAELRTLIKAK